MKNIFIIDTTYPINTRTARFKNTFKKFLIVNVCAWNRGGGTPKEDDCSIYNSNVGYGNKFKKLIYLPLFIFFSIKTYKDKKSDIIFASHWDSLICAVAIKFTCNWKLKIFYDCIDMPTASSKFFSKIIRSLERFNLNFVDLTIFASRYFKNLYPEKLNTYIFENYPSLVYLNSKERSPIWFNNFNIDTIKGRKNVAWIGVVRYFEIIENILLAIKESDFYLYVFGDGPDLEKVKNFVNKLGVSDRVVFFGRYEASDLSFIYDLTNLVWAAYPTKDFNAVYAISNKYFECSYFEKTPIFSKKTKMAENLSGNPSVVLLDEYSVSDIREKILSVESKKHIKFVKYEDDSSWEKKEAEFIEYLKEIL